MELSAQHVPDIGEGRAVDPSRQPIVVVDDHELLSATLVYALAANGFDAHRCVTTEPAEVHRELAGYQPGLVLLDLDLGRGTSGEPIDGAELVPSLRAAGWSVLVVTGSADLDRIADAVAGGALGWVLKTAPLDRLVHLAGEAVAGRPVLSAADRAALIARHRERRAVRDSAMSRLNRLSAREWEVLARLADGSQAATIAGEFYTSLATVRAQIRSILAKLEVGSQLAAVAMAHQFWADRLASARRTGPAGGTRR